MTQLVELRDAHDKFKKAGIKLYAISYDDQQIDVPAIWMHMGHGQREALYNGTPHLRRLLWRKIREHPLGFLRFQLKNVKLELQARGRRRGK